MKARDNTVWGNEGETPARGQSLLAGDGEPQATRLRGGLIESAPQSGEERGREHYGRKEERPRVRNEEKTYDYKGLLISRWRGVAWGSGVETGGTRGAPAFALRDACRRWPCGNGLEDLSCCMMPCTAQVRGPACSFGRVGLVPVPAPVPVPVPVPPSCLGTRDTRCYIRPDGRLFFLPHPLPICLGDAAKV